jgi:hypothetical protein
VTDQGTTTTTTSTATGFDPATHPAHLGHALEGLQRYPNYLQRWNDDAQVQRLEEALAAQLAQVRHQRQQALGQRQASEQLVRDFLESPQGQPFLAFVSKPPSTWEEMRRDMLDPRLVQAMEGSWRIQKQQKQQKQSSLGRASSQSLTAFTPPPLPWQGALPDDRLPVRLEASQLQVLMEQEVPDVYSFPLLQPVFCQRLVAYLTALATYREQHPTSDSDSTHTRTRWLDLDHVGLAWLNDWLRSWMVQPLAAHLFVDDCHHGNDGSPSSAPSGNDGDGDGSSGNNRFRLDWRQGYLAAYTHKPDTVRPRQGLVAHTDDSEVTLNLCLNDSFTGGNLALFGLRGSPEEGRLQDEYEPQMGRALLHSGRYLHAVTDVTSGDRYALILWTRSWSGIRATTCPCCWLTRRQPSSSLSSQGGRAATCICGRAWN